MASPSASRRLESLSGAARYADISTRTLRRYIAAGDVQAFRVGPRMIKVDLNDLDAMMRPVNGLAAAPRSA